MEKTQHPKRGDIFYVVDDPNKKPIGSETWPNRAGLVVSNDGICKASSVVTIVWLTTSENKQITPTHIPVTSGNKKAIAMCEAPTSVDIRRFRNSYGHVSEEEMEEVSKGLMFGLQLNTGINPQGIFKKWENDIHKYNIVIEPPMQINNR